MDASSLDARVQEADLSIQLLKPTERQDQTPCPRLRGKSICPSTAVDVFLLLEVLTAPRRALL